MFLIGIFGIIVLIYMVIRGLWSLIPWLILAVLVTSTLGFIIDHWIISIIIAFFLFGIWGMYLEKQEKKAENTKTEESFDEINNETLQTHNTIVNENSIHTSKYSEKVDPVVPDLYSEENISFSDYPDEDVNDHEDINEYDDIDDLLIDKKNVKVVGTSYTNSEKILRNVVKDQGGVWNIGGYQKHHFNLSLVPDPDNEYDPNAIKVVSNYNTPKKARIKRSGRIGYLPKDLGLTLEKEEVVRATVKEGYGHFGVTVDLSKLDF